MFINDSDLLFAASSGDQHAFKFIYERYWQLLYIAALKVLKDEEEAKDVVQEVFSSILQKEHKIEIHTTLAAYLYSAVRYKTFDVLSRIKVRNHHQDSLAAFINHNNYSTDRVLIERETTALIEKEIANLPPKMKEVFELSRKNELSYKEIAEILNISDKTVKKQIHKALKVLKPKFSDYRTMLFLVLYPLFK